MIYEPREDSFLIKEYIKGYAKGKILDIGTGSGILALEALKYSKDVLAVDVNPEAVNEANKKGLNAKVSDLFSNVKGKFDLIIFNPPYLPEDPKEDDESKLATTGGKRGCEIIEKFLKKAKKHLNKGGVILLLFSTLSGDVEGLIKKYKFNYKLLEEKPLFFEKLKVCALTIKSSGVLFCSASLPVGGL